MFIFGFHIDRRPKYQDFESLRHNFYRKDEMLWAVMAERDYYRELLSSEKIQSWEQRNDEKKKRKS
jgi:hypothetical protein